MGKKTGPKTNWKMTPEVIGKLEQAFSIDATIAEACFYADINEETYYRWEKNDPELSKRFKRLRNKPVLKARQRVVKGIDESYSNAMDYLKRKRKDEFSEKTEQSVRIEDPMTLEHAKTIMKLYGSLPPVSDSGSESS